MKVAEQLVEDAAIDLSPADRHFKRQHQPADAHQVFVALAEVVVEELEECRSGLVWRHARYPCCRAVEGANSPRALVKSTSGRNGLVRCSVAPAASAISRLPSSPRVVSTTTGTSRDD